MTWLTDELHESKPDAGPCLAIYADGKTRRKLEIGLSCLGGGRRDTRAG